MLTVDDVVVVVVLAVVGGGGGTLGGGGDGVKQARDTLNQFLVKRIRESEILCIVGYLKKHSKLKYPTKYWYNNSVGVPHDARFSGILTKSTFETRLDQTNFHKSLSQTGAKYVAVK